MIAVVAEVKCVIPHILDIKTYQTYPISDQSAAFKALLKSRLVKSWFSHTLCYLGGILCLSISPPVSQWAQQGQGPLCSHANVNKNAKTLAIGVSQQSKHPFHADLRYDDESRVFFSPQLQQMSTQTNLSCAKCQDKIIDR